MSTARARAARSLPFALVALAVSCSGDEATSGSPGFDGEFGGTYGAGGGGSSGGVPPGGGAAQGAGAIAGGGGATVGAPGCGNGVIEPGEECDGAQLNGATCASATMGALPNGSVTCVGCLLDTAGCSGAGTGGAGTGGTLGTGGAPGTGGGGGLGGSTGQGGSTSVSGVAPTNLPSPQGACPNLVTGAQNVLGANVQLWAGPPGAGGPVVFYWHGTGSNSREAVSGLGQAAIDEVTRNGGLIASFESSTGQGQNTGNNVWYTGDFAVADHLLACAIEQLDVDTSRVHAAGYSAGGLQTGTMAFLRSNYIASVLIYSGGAIVTSPNPEPGRAVPTICAHGAQGSDVVVIDFANACRSYLDNVKGRGGMAIDCDDGGGHVNLGRLSTMSAPGWQFFKDHPFGVNPSPYVGGLPSFPATCALR
ncbi:MAG: hypothetical protein FJ104_03790 [Deltaproteobacteria bacterium]|nr:hypothetical protein [Deltaproteobacteria bacterium]